MAKRSFKTSLSFLLILLLLSGCWDALDIEDRDICTSIIVDKDDDQYAFYAEIPAVSSKIQKSQGGQESGGQQPQISVIKAHGRSYAEARLDLDRQLNKPVYLGAVQSLILTERLADESISEYALRLRQLTEYRKTMDVIVTPDDPEAFLKTVPENESTVGFAIEDTLETLSKQGTTYHLTLAELLQKLESENPCYLMNTLSVREGQLTMIGNAVFHGGKRIGFIPVEESQGLVYITARMKNKLEFDYLVNVGNVTHTMETTLERRSIKARFDGEKPIFDVTMKFEAAGLYPSEKTIITDEVRKEIAAKMEEQLEGVIRNTIDKSQKEYGCDYMSFSEPFRIAYPVAFKAMDWEEAFKKAQFNIQITVEEKPNRNIDYNPEPVI